MPWKERSIMEQRAEFCALASQEGSTIRELCRRYGISPTTGYRWLARYQAAGREGLTDRSRRPHHSPGQTPAEMEAAVVALRQEHPAWGGRKLHARLLALGTSPPVPSASSITRILHRHGLIDPAVRRQHRPVIRFCAPFPNDLWQMDFKGHFALGGGGRCHPLTVLDDASRFNLGIRALPNEQHATVQPELIQLFQRYGLPNRILCDHGLPWGNPRGEQVTALGLWLLQLDIPVIHGRPYHPQTQGKEERFHRTLVAELLATQCFATLEAAQDAFDAFRQVYNQERPHEALDLTPPLAHYHPSPRAYPDRLPAIEYPDGMLVRTVNARGVVALDGQRYFIGEALAHYPVGLRPTADPAIDEVLFRHYPIGRIDRRRPVA